MPAVAVLLMFYYFCIIPLDQNTFRLRRFGPDFLHFVLHCHVLYHYSLWQRPKSPESRCFQCRQGIWPDPQRQNGQAEQKARICEYANTISFWKPVYISPALLVKEAYLPGTEDTVISKAVPPGRGPSIALRLGWSLRLPQMWVTRVRNLLVWGSAFALTPEQINSRTVRSSLSRAHLSTAFHVHHADKLVSPESVAAQYLMEHAQGQHVSLNFVYIFCSLSVSKMQLPVLLPAFLLLQTMPVFKVTKSVIMTVFWKNLLFQKSFVRVEIKKWCYHRSIYNSWKLH